MKKFNQIIAQIGNSLQTYVLLAIRLFWGSEFFIGGLGKLLNPDKVAGFFSHLGIPFPYFNALLVGSTELFGGFLLFIGLFSRLASVPLMVIMATAFATSGIESVKKIWQLDFEPFYRYDAFLFGCAAIIIFCFGPGKLSLDYLLSKDKSRLP